MDFHFAIVVDLSVQFQGIVYVLCQGHFIDMLIHLRNMLRDLLGRSREILHPGP